MRKIIFLFTLTILIILSGCSNNTNNDIEKASVAVNKAIGQPSTEEKIKTGASASVDYIDFEATVITEQNFDELNTEFDDKLSKSAFRLSTQIVLTMNNHRDDLASFDYKELATLDGATAQGWRQFDEKMGGHHVGGVLTFPKVEKPQMLVITGLPVGDAVLTF